MDKNNKMKKQEYFKLVKHINKNVRAVGYRYVRCFSEPRKKGTKYRTKLWAAGNGEQLVEYINTNFGDKVKAELLEPNFQTNPSGYQVGGYGYYYQGGVAYRPLNKIV